MSGGGDDPRMQLASLAPIAPGMTPPNPSQLRTNLHSMREFKKRVDGLVLSLADSEAEPTSMAECAMPVTTLGTGFIEATGLHRVYTHVQEQLVVLSRLLSGQIDAYSTAIEGCGRGYEQVDLAARDSMWAVQANAQQHYNPALDPYAEPATTHGGQDAGQGDSPQQPAGNEKEASPPDGPAKPGDTGTTF